MAQISDADLQKFISQSLAEYHERLFQKLSEQKLKTILKRKNPYLFRAKALESAPDLIKVILDAFMSSQEETIFGGFLERLAVHVCQESYGGMKSTAEGIDLDFMRDDVRYLVAVKSGPNWGNSSQIARLKDNFRKAKKILGTNASTISVVAVNGCCYGNEGKEDKGDYLKLCGRSFWELVTGEDEFYQRIIEPLGVDARKKTEAFNEEYSKVINRFTREFMEEFCDESGAINWNKLLEFNSGRPRARST